MGTDSFSNWNVMVELLASDYMAPPIQYRVYGPPNGRWPIKPYSESKYRPINERPGSRPALRRLRQMGRV